MDNNLDYKNLDKIKELIIDILSPPLIVFNNKIFEIFFTLLNFVKKAKKWLLMLPINYLVTFFLLLAIFY